MGTDTYTCGYDPLGNRTSGHGQSVVDYLSSELNQYTNIHNGVTNTPSYDPDGNLIAHGEWSFSWNGENRLIKSESAASVPDAAKVKVENLYDYMGRRVRKTVSSDYSGGSYTTTNVTTFVYDGWLPIAEINDDGSSVSTNYHVWGIDASGSLQGAGGVGGLLATIQNGQTYFACMDGSGNVTEYVDTNGTIVAHREYSPFGQTIVATGTKKDDFNLWFSSKYFDQETGLGYWSYRFYAPALGRFLNRDPIQELGGFNIYAYTRNMPTGVIDTHGLDNNVVSCCSMDLSTTEADGSAWASEADEWEVLVYRQDQICIPIGPSGAYICIPVVLEEWWDSNSGIVWENIAGKSCRKKVKCKQGCKKVYEGQVCSRWTVSWGEENISGRIGGGPAPNWACHIDTDAKEAECEQEGGVQKCL